MGDVLQIMLDPRNNGIQGLSMPNDATSATNVTRGFGAR